jgi:hypothetical protein
VGDARPHRGGAVAAVLLAALLSSDEPLTIGSFVISGEVKQRIGAEIGARIGGWSQDAARAALRVGAGAIDFFFMPAGSGRSSAASRARQSACSARTSGASSCSA